MAVLDNAAQINTIILKYVSDHSLQVGPITNHVGSKVTCVGLGYIVIQVQVERVWGYVENQIALVILALSNFAARIPVILGTPTMDQVINVIKEAKVAMPWTNARVAHLLSVHRMVPMEVGEGQKEEVGTNGY